MLRNKEPSHVIFYCSTFLAAFLLFQIELIVAKILLPVYGGSYAVWGGCLVFFQAVLLLGYVFAHYAIKSWGITRHRIVHLFLLFLPLILSFPGQSLHVSDAKQNSFLMLDIFYQLLITIGPAFFVLSTMSLVLQAWMVANVIPAKVGNGRDRSLQQDPRLPPAGATSLKISGATGEEKHSGVTGEEKYLEVTKENNPYVLYAVSNWGSMLGLLTYPFFFEWQFGIKDQLEIWKAGYIALCVFQILGYIMIKVKGDRAFAFVSLRTPLLSLRGGAVLSDDEAIPKLLINLKTSIIERLRDCFASLRSARNDTRELPSEESKDLSLDINGKKMVIWILLGACGVVSFLSVTNIVTSEIAPIPLLWIIPLALYLLSFILNFQSRPFAPAWIQRHIHIIIASGVIVYFQLFQLRIFSIKELMELYTVQFLICMFCQKELVDQRPSDAKNLTLFYVAIALGSFLGGIFVSWVVPLVSNSFIEYFITFLLISIVLIFKEQGSRVGINHFRLITYLLVFIALWPICFTRPHFAGFVLMAFILIIAFHELRKNARAFNLLIVCLIGFLPFLDMIWFRQIYIYQHRNYYGLTKVYEQDRVRYLMHATTTHGAQSLQKRYAHIPLTYYAIGTPVSEVLTTPQFQWTDIAIVGLGAGTLATYLKKDQTLDFYELDPDIVTMANEFFTYTSLHKEQIHFFLGDARLSFKQNVNKRYDAIIVDAFSGDTIPAHLLTTEAIDLYRQRLRPEGVILFHISNRYVNLAPVLLSNARLLKGYVCGKQNAARGDAYGSSWVAMTWSKVSFQIFIQELHWLISPQDKKSYLRAWSDDYSHLLSAFKMEDIIGMKKASKSLKH